LAIKNKKGKQFKHTYIFFGYLVEPCIEIWQCFRLFFFRILVLFKKIIEFATKKIQNLYKKEVGGSQYPTSTQRPCLPSQEAMPLQHG